MPHIIDRLRRRPLIHLWGPVFLWMAVISFFSSRSTLPPPFSSTCRHSPFFRGAAHFGEFAFRSALLCGALTAGEQNDGRRGNPEEDDPPRSGANLWSKGSPFGISFAIGSFLALADG